MSVLLTTLGIVLFVVGVLLSVALHELGHLIQDENGDWLIPDDGFDGRKSKENTLRVQQACRKELNALN